MVVVAAFNTLANTTNAGLTAYYRATGCTALTIADVIPLFSKIVAYEQEYIIGEVLIWDTGNWGSGNCTMVRMIVYNDGWVIAWFNHTAHSQGGAQGAGASYVSSNTLENFGTTCEYEDKWNGYQLKITGSIDPECPIGTTFTITDTDSINGRIIVNRDDKDGYHFNIGYTYIVSIHTSNAMMVWWGTYSWDESLSNPPSYSNKLYRAIYEAWVYLRYSSNTTDRTNISISKAFYDDGGSFSDETGDFNDSGTNDCPLMPAIEDVNDAFYYGSSIKFQGLKLNIGQAGVGGTIVWEYWDGSTWSSLTVTDLTSGFTVLTVHNHKVDDTINSITSPEATNQATLNTLLNEIKNDYNTHRVSTTFHEVADTTNNVSSADATNETTSVTLANEIKSDYNAHRSQTDVHPYNDDENDISVANAIDLTTCITLANEIKLNYNSHLVSTQDANTVLFTPPDDWVKTFVNSNEQYWIRSRVSVAGYTTQPILTQGWIIISNDISNYLDTNLGLYSFEYTSANYILMSGVSGYKTNQYFTLMILPGRTIYSSDISYSLYVTYNWSKGQILLNTQSIYSYQYMASENGYTNRNIDSMFAPVNIQNIFYTKVLDQTSTAGVYRVAILLYTS